MFYLVVRDNMCEKDTPHIIEKSEDRWNKDTAEMFPVQIDKRTGTITIRDKESVVRVRVGVLR